MIVNIRGTSGSGKTYLVRELMARAGPRHEVREAHPQRAGRDILVGYLLPLTALTAMAVVGDYTAECGGCDKFSWKGAADWVQGRVTELALKRNHVIFEGAMVSSWTLRRFREMEVVAPVRVVVLTTPLADCLASVEARRRARGNDAPLNTSHTTDRYRSILSMGQKHRAMGLHVEFLSRAEALAYCCELLSLPKELP